MMFDLFLLVAIVWGAVWVVRRVVKVVRRVVKSQSLRFWR